LVKIWKKAVFLYIEILGVLLLENSIAWETKRIFFA
tara:strand:+ start:549 stop:656 length:108 start_codon:yes stop_codon:yes gene_type:complete